MKKVIVCFCAVVCLVMGCLIPCSAETWDEVSPVITTPFTGYPAYSNNETNTQMVIDIVELATDLGMFGGAQPVQIYYKFDSANRNTYIMVAAPATNASGFYIYAGGGSKKALYTARTMNVNYQYVTMASDISIISPWVMYCLQTSGDWGVTQYYSVNQYLSTSNTPLGSQSSDIYKRVATWNPALQTWHMPSDTQTDKDIIGWGNDTGEFVGLSTILNKYETQYELLTYTPEPATYTLNIASIFDGYFNGVRDIFNGFDINLFGINIIGVLIAILVITIVAFIVRKLWK